RICCRNGQRLEYRTPESFWSTTDRSHLTISANNPERWSDCGGTGRTFNAEISPSASIGHTDSPHGNCAGFQPHRASPQFLNSSHSLPFPQMTGAQNRSASSQPRGGCTSQRRLNVPQGGLVGGSR